MIFYDLLLFLGIGVLRGFLGKFVRMLKDCSGKVVGEMWWVFVRIWGGYVGGMCLRTR